MAGEMHESEVTREAYPLHFAIADAFGGEVKPFDHYQGPYVAIGGDLTVGRAPYAMPVQHLGIVRLWICSEDGEAITVYNEANDKQSEPFLPFNDDAIDAEQIVEVARQVLDMKPA